MTGRVIIRLSIDRSAASGDTQAAAAQEGLGLVGMRERAALVGGTLEIESVPGEGTTVVNDPRALRDWNEKLAILRFPKLTPPMVVASPRRSST